MIYWSLRSKAQKKGKKRKPTSKENDYSDLEIKETIHHSIKDRSCLECGSLMKGSKSTISYELKYKPFCLIEGSVGI